jgi:hypothetical protein
MTEVASVPGAEDFGDQAAEFIARAQQIAALGLPVLPGDAPAAAAMRAAGYVVIAECAEVAGTTAIVSVLSEDEDLEQSVAAAELAAALGVDLGQLAGMEFLATFRETPETGPVLSGFRRLPELDVPTGRSEGAL